MKASPTALGALVTPALDYAAALGLDVEALVAHAGLPTPFDPQVRVKTSSLLALWEEAARRSGDFFFGLHAGENHVAARSVHIVGFAARQSKTLGDCYAVTSELGRMTNEGSRIDFTRTSRGAGRLEIGAAAGLPVWPRAYNEMALAAYLSTGRRWTGQVVKPLTVEFQHAPVGDLSEYVRLFGAVPRFGAPINALTFDAEVLDAPLADSDPALSAYLKEQAHKQLGDDPEQRLIERVRDAVRLELPKGARASAIAKRLAMSERTLQRRLAETQSALGLKQLIDDVRRLHAIDALARPGASVSDVARACGFADVASFREAFKRWTGSVPSELKRVRRART